MTNDDHGAALKSGYATNQGQIVFARAPVAVKFYPFVRNGLDIVQGAGSTRMTSDLQPLGGGQVRKKDEIPKTM
jgi:hypothetical protein